MFCVIGIPTKHTLKLTTRDYRSDCLDTHFKTIQIYLFFVEFFTNKVIIAHNIVVINFMMALTMPLISYSSLVKKQVVVKKDNQHQLSKGFRRKHIVLVVDVH